MRSDTTAALAAALALAIKLRPTLALAAIASLAACDPCDSAARIHLRRCSDGDQESCAWLVEHGAVAGPKCTVKP